MNSWTLTILHCLSSGSSDFLLERLKSRRPLVPAFRNLLNNLFRLRIRASQWTNYRWNAEYCENASRCIVFIPMTSARPVKMSLMRTTWVKLNRLRTGLGRFHLLILKCGLAPSLNCDCGTIEQTVDRIQVNWSKSIARKQKGSRSIAGKIISPTINLLKKQVAQKPNFNCTVMFNALCLYHNAHCLILCLIYLLKINL